MTIAIEKVDFDSVLAVGILICGIANVAIAGIFEVYPTVTISLPCGCRITYMEDEFPTQTTSCRCGLNLFVAFNPNAN